LPTLNQKSFNRFSAAVSVSNSAGGLVFGAGATTAIQSNLSRLVRPMFKAWPDPIDMPAMARLARSVRTE
jgi:hypothetical protein